MARKKSAAAKHVEAEEAQGAGQEGHGKITKSEAVRRALADGVDQPADGVAYILSQFGIEMGPQHFSAVKSAHLKKLGVATVNTRFQKAETPAKEAVPAGEPDLLAAIEAMKPLVAALGADKVKRIADLLS